MCLFMLIFVHANGEESYWYKPFRTIVEACECADAYGFEDEHYHVVNVNDTLVMTGKVDKSKGIYNVR